MASRSLYAPTVDSFQPAFSIIPGEDNKCKIRFALSRLNGTQDFACVHATVRKQDSGLSAVEPTGLRETGIILDIPLEKDDNGFYITISDKDIKTMSSSNNYPGWVPGYIYKVQLRLSEITYTDTKENLTQYQWLNKNANRFSEWSTFCIIKATGRFRIQVPAFNRFDSLEYIYNDNENNELFVENLNFLGSFISEDDKSETLLSYQIDIYKKKQDNLFLVNSSGTIFAEEKEGNTALRYNPKIIFTRNESYRIVLTYKTINYYTSSIDFDVFYNPSLNDSRDIAVLTLENDKPYFLQNNVENNSLKHDNLHHIKKGSQVPLIMRGLGTIAQEEEEGRVALCLYSLKNESLSTNVIVKRASSKDNFEVWEDIRIFNFINQSPSPNQENELYKKVFYDYTIESGIYYKYATQTEDEYGNRSAIYLYPEFKPVIRNFESSYLLGENNKQLKLKFDNTLTNFKINVSEANVDPLGGKYSIFSKNGDLRYKNFQIGGLISLQMDDNKLFTSPKELYGDENGDYASIISLRESAEGLYGQNLYSINYEKDFRNVVIDFLYDGKVKLFKSPTEGNILVRLKDINFTPNQQLGRLIYSFTATAFEIDEYNYENCLKYKLANIGKIIKDFSKKTYKIGQLYNNIQTKGEVFKINKETGKKEFYTQDGDNIIKKIYDKHDFSGQNMAGQLYSMLEVCCLKINIYNKPLKTDKGIKGFKLEYNGMPIYVTSPLGIYEFDENVIFDKTDTLYICSDEEGYLTEADMSIDFVYSLKTTKFKGKQIKTRTNKRGLGQLHEFITPDTSLFSLIYNKYYFETDNANNSANIHFRRLDSVYAICIEANPGSVFGIEIDEDVGLKEFEIGDTSILNLYNITDIEKIRYLGYRDRLSGKLINIGTNVILDYCYYTKSGLYQEEDI